MWGAVGAVVLWMLSGAGWAADYRAGAGNYREMLPRLQPGDRLLLEHGVYRRGLPLHDLAGRVDRPITIEAANPLLPPRFIARPGANTVSLLNVRYLVLRYLELDGRAVPVDAIKAEGHGRFADFITLEHLYIHDHAASQQNVGISTKCPARGWVIRNNRIERVGTGMYLGDADGTRPFVGGVIEANHISRTLGYNLQIKHQITRSSGVVSRHNTVIRYNVFSKREAVPGALARPNVLLGHFPLAGPGSADRYLVYGNAFLSNPDEALLQAEGRVAIYGNLFLNDSGDGIHIQPHNDVPRDMLIFSNTVLASGMGIYVRPAGNALYRQRVVGNVVAAAIPLRGGERTHNVTLPYRKAWLSTPVAGLTGHLLQVAGQLDGLPAAWTHEFRRYPGWRGDSGHPGASVSPVLIRTLGGTQP